MNVAHFLPERAHSAPNHIAIHCATPLHHYMSYTYKELEELSNSYAQGIAHYGIKKGHRIVLMIRPGIDFIATTFALMKLGVVVVLIDPGIGHQFLAECIKNVEPHGFFGVPKAHLLRVLSPSSFATSHFNVVVGPRWFFGVRTLSSFLSSTPSTPVLIETRDSDPAAIIFTTGSTGLPKGVVYEHGMFLSQIKILQEHYKIGASDVDMPTFPLFALFSVAMGTTCVIPHMDPTKPALVNPENIIRPILDKKVTYCFGSPALWHRVTEYCLDKKISLPSIKRVLIAGAPVRSELLERFTKILSTDAHVYTPYGATEALPVTSIDHHDILSHTAKLTQTGKGICVGSAFKNVSVKIIKITENAIPHWKQELELQSNQIGEICVMGPHITKEYFHNLRGTALAKIKEAESLWHRMGDVGYLDSDHRLWFCGRKAHRVVTQNGQTLFSIPCESIFNQHKEVFRAALVGVHGVPIIVIEPKNKKILTLQNELKRLQKELLTLGSLNTLTVSIRKILFHPSFPVDIRHNAKINREKLTEWASTELA